MSRIVLASRSPRRRALLESLGLEVHVVPSGAEEHFEGTPEEMVVSNAVLKRDEVRGRGHEGDLVIAADTLVFLEGEPLGKPDDLDGAREMLRRLSGRTHQVITGVAVWNGGTQHGAEGCETTGVTFRELSDEVIDTFVETVKPLDRAGAYTVDGPGMLLVAGYEGCYQNVLGLPITLLDRLLQKTGMNLDRHIDAARATFL